MEGAGHRLPLHTAGLRVSGLSGGGALGSPPRVSVRPGEDRASEGPTGGRVASPRSPGVPRGFCVVPQPVSGSSQLFCVLKRTLELRGFECTDSREKAVNAIKEE
ncbi:hypothetical protein NDU88_001593 [Pleurodeles waltl]|uniref:Uncharacterized protein n=1 Tax=Pleurodeles waltl TaxID=8319 RepID=A0AAV7KPV3_PLEWA|nr:hypothetical protein NDU88_001593 [Pleurodeles waltl]